MNDDFTLYVYPRLRLCLIRLLRTQELVGEALAIGWWMWSADPNIDTGIIAWRAARWARRGRGVPMHASRYKGGRIDHHNRHPGRAGQGWRAPNPAYQASIREEVRRAFRACKRPLETAICQRYMDGESSREIAVGLNVKRSSVRCAMWRIRQRLTQPVAARIAQQ